MIKSKENSSDMDIMPFFEIIVSAVLFCSYYKHRQNNSFEEANAKYVQKKLEILTGRKIPLHYIEGAKDNLYKNGLIDANWIIKAFSLPEASICFKVKDLESDRIRNHYYDRQELIAGVISLFICERKPLSVKSIQDELRKRSGIIVKQNEINKALSSIRKAGIIDEEFHYLKPQETELSDREEIENTIKIALDMERDVLLGIWPLVTFGVICCLRNHPEYKDKTKILKESEVCEKIQTLVGVSTNEIRQFVFGDIKKELIDKRLINSALNITVEDLSEGNLFMNTHPVIGPFFARLDFVSMLAFHAIYLLNKNLPHDKKPRFHEIVEQMKKTAEDYSKDCDGVKFTLSNIDRKNVPLIISFLYAQGIIDKKFKIVLPDLSRYEIAVRDLDMDTDDTAKQKEIRIKEHIIQKCLISMGCLNEYTDSDTDEDGTYCYRYDEGDLEFPRFRTEEVATHEKFFREHLCERAFLENIVGNRESPFIPEFTTGQRFLWECFDARKNNAHKEFYYILVRFVSRFLYENTVFFKELLGAERPLEISRRLGITVPGDEVLEEEAASADALLKVADLDFNRIPVDELLDIESIEDLESERAEIIDERKPLMEKDVGVDATKDFINFIKLVDNCKTAHDTEQIRKMLQLQGERDEILPFAGSLWQNRSTANTSGEAEVKQENENRKNALCVLLYGLYRFAREHKT